MKLGIMSDSHGRARVVRQAIGTLEAAGAEAFVHCGDIGGLEVLEEFAGRKLWFVWGNTDVPSPSWRAEIETLGLDWPEGSVSFRVERRQIVVFHGHERGFDAAIHSQQFDYVLHGHTHQRANRRQGRTRVINPGALHRAPAYTVALLDPVGDEVMFLDLDRG
jgi:hypothetical protein